MNKLILKLLLTTFVMCSAVSAAPSSPVAASSPLLASTASPSQPAIPLQEAIALREQNKIIREYHSSLLDTVYWALGGVFTLAALLSGFGWWSNFRVYEADKRRLREELDVQLKEAQSAAIIREKDSQQALIASVNTKLDSLTTRFGNESIELRRETAALRVELTNAISNATKPIATTEARIDTLSQGLAARESELRHVEEYVWDLKGNVANVLITQGQGITAALAAKNKFYLQSAVRRMKSTIETKILNTNAQLSARVLDILRSRVADAEKDEPVAASELLALIAKIKIESEAPSGGA